MIVNRTILVILGLVLLIGSAAAIDLSPSNISSSNPGWLIANDGNDHSTITVYALKAGSPPTPVTTAIVTFTLDPASQDLGTISPAAPASVQTGADGKATAVFTTSKKSGTATIIATISFYDGSATPVQVSTIQRIDHDTPQAASFENPAELPVGSVTRVNVTLVDRWGNRIDNKNTAESVRLTMADEGGAGLQDGPNYVPQKTYSTDAEGNVSAVLRISTAVRSNYIQMDPIGNIVVPPCTYIQGVAESEPYYIAQTAASPGSSLPANGDLANAVEIYYTVTDKYDNPITGASVYCNSTDGMSVTAPTNTWGLLRISFGPKDTVGFYTLMAVPLGNTSAVCKETGTVGSCSQVVEYYSTDPVDLTFTGNPQSMTSLDVDSSSRAVLQARVIDIKGNPVTGELVRFSLGTPSYPGGPYYNITSGPSLQFPTANVTGGYATVEFYPGSFAGYTNPGYNATSTGQVVATATWINKTGVPITRDVTLVWKNYPYISTSSIGNCGNSQVGDKINITIQLSGDGAALRPKPVDAIMVMDVSLSMSSTPKMDGPAGLQYKLYYAKLAGTTFVNQMDPGKDKIGLVTYSTNANVANSLSTNFAGVVSGLNSMTAVLYTNQRMGMKLAIENMIANSNNPNAIKALIVMTDGQYNQDGDPLARGTGTHIKTSENTYTYYYDWYQIPASGGNAFTQTPNDQNMATYARLHNIRIYTVTFGTEPAIQPGTDLYNTMDAIAAQSNGTHFHANDGYQLTDVYTAIAGALQETAGGETHVALDFGTVKINDDPALDIRNYMNYVYESHSPAQSSDSTYINKTNLTPTGVYHQLISETRDDTASWAARTLAFDVGTIKLNETWSATFRLNLTKMGKIDLFGPGSTISFKDAATNATQTGFIPAMQCRVQQSIVNTGFGSRTLRVDNLSEVIGASPDPNVWTIKWNTTYDGAKTVQEAILYRVTGDPHWTTVPGGLVFISTPVFEETKQHTLSTSDTTLWPPGKCFDIEIVAGAEDANAARTDAVQKCKAPSSDTIYIKLE